ncbi:hypothetical protein [Burkholderia pseudomallei]|uniref:hypothetical protein n=1 Tax=Burkholderia pseudomallei TaxID=28450 RepID=UPI0022EB0625|nr:hypothetical protein [Burkholderia pseudomallei]
MGRIPAGLGAVVLVMRAFSRRRARIVRAFGLLARCVARRRFRAVVGARAPRAPDRIVIRVIALLLAPQKKFCNGAFALSSQSMCRASMERSGEGFGERRNVNGRDDPLPEWSAPMQRWREAGEPF